MKPIVVKLDSSSQKRGKSRKKKLNGYERSLLKNSKVSSPKRISPEQRKKIKKILVRVFVFVILFTAITAPIVYVKIYQPAMVLKQSALELVDQARIVKGYVDEQDLVALQADLPGLEEKLAEVRDGYEHFSFAKKIPYAKGYYANGEHVFNAAEQVFPIAEDMITAATPIADVFGFKTESGEHEEVTGEEKIETIVRNMPDISATLASGRPQIDSIIDELNQIDPKYIPSEIKGIKLRETFEDVHEKLGEAKQMVTDLEYVLNILPEFAGVPEQKTYLLLFQNDKEIRPTGGFLTAYGYLEVENGKLGDIESEDIYNLDQNIYTYVSAPEEVRKYLGQNEWHLRDSNLYVDLVSSSLKFEERYQEQHSPRDFEGIIYIDTQMVEALLGVVGEIPMYQYGTTITQENVVYELELYSEILHSGSSDRKQFMEDLMGELVDRLLNANKDQWGDLFTSVWGGMESKHLLFYFHDPELQELASKYGFTCEIDQEWEGDYLHINEANMGGLKANMYVTGNVTQDVSINKSNEIFKTVKIHWENPEVKDHWLNGPYTAWVRIYVPYGSELIDGGVSIRTVNEEWNEPSYGKTIFETNIIVPTAEEEDGPPGTYDLEFTYKLQSELNFREDDYNLLIQKQAGKPEEPYYIYVNGENYSLELDKDEEVRVNL